MSGALGVPLMIVGVVWPNTRWGILLGITGIVAVFFASYRVWKREREANVSALDAMRFVYPNEPANSDSKLTLFRETYRFLPDGQPIKHQLTLVRIYIGIENMMDKTLRNVRLVIESVTIPPRPTDLHCPSKRNGAAVIDIQPRGMELFLIGEGYDASDGAGVIIRQPGEIDKIAEFSAQVAFSLGTTYPGPHPLLRNDGYTLGFSAYADDAPAISGEANLNAKAKIEFHLRPGASAITTADPATSAAALP